MLLAVDTSTAQMGLALYDGAQVLAESAWISASHHTQSLAPAAQEMLSQTGLRMDSVSVLAVAIGPGSFTSLRVGVSFVKGLALARKIPVVGINTLDILAFAQPAIEIPLIALLQAGRNKFAWVRYHAGAKGWQAEGSASVATLPDLMKLINDPHIVCGELNAEERAQIQTNKNVLLASPAMSVRRPSLLAELGWQKWKLNEVENAAALAPIYLRTEGTPE